MKLSRRILLVVVLLLATSGLAFAAKALRLPARLKSKAKSLVAAHAASENKSPPSTPPPTEALPPISREYRIVQEVYVGGLKNSWEDWGWADRTITGPGPAVIDFSNWAGWILHHSSQPSSFGALVFRVKTPLGPQDFLEVRLMSDTASLDPVNVSARHLFVEKDGWTQVIVPFYELNPFEQPFDGVRIRARAKVDGGRVQIDSIGLSAPLSGPVPSREFPTREGSITIQCAAPTTPISPLIFGLGGKNGDAELRATTHRFGGNPTSRFNWTLGNVWNTAADWYYRNVAVGHWTELLEFTKARRADLTVTLPLLGWVARDDRAYSFPVAVYGAQAGVDPDHPDIGNGVAPGGKELTPGDPRRTSIPAPPELVGKWVEMIKEESEKRGHPIHSYILDNEPCLWNSTHRDVHPEPLGYDELLERTLAYGAAIRKADPRAVIAGPAEWGWPNYFWSAVDGVGGNWRNGPDRRAHGGTPLLEWYLQKLREHEVRTGVHILDVVDLHFYPQGKNLYGGGHTDLETALRRIRATRSLWDPSYVDESWIKESIHLIPRMKDIIARNFPGREISIGEWNFGGEEHISGGLATAEALGRFAQEGIRSAYYWTAPKSGTPAYWAFRAFRNFDGKGGSFLDRFVSSTAPKDASVFASRNASSSHFVVLVLTLTNTNALKVKFDVSSCGAVDSWRTLVYTGRPAGFAPSKTGRTGEISDTLPPFSMTVLEFSTKKPVE